MKKHLLFLLFVFSCTLAYPVVSKSVQSTAGTLSTLFNTTEKLAITDLTVTGTLDARDVRFLRDNLISLTTLNLSDASILAYTGKAGTDTLASSYPANELPSKSFDRNVNTSKAALRSIILPKNLVSIGFGAFIDCASLSNVVFPAAVTKIGNYAFFGCDGLSSVVIPGSVQSIGDYAFGNCDALTSVSIPQSVTRLGDWSFSNCTALPAISLPSSIVTVGSHTFYGCTKLTSVTLPEGVASIGEAAFARCASLESISLPSTVNVLGESLFSGCSMLKNVSLPVTTDSIPTRAFSDCDALTGFNFPASVSYLGIGAFHNCSNLSSVTFPTSLTTVGEGAFEYCIGLTSVTLPTTLTTINKGAFSSCTGLTSLSFPSSVTRVDDWAFYGCTGLTRLTLPASIDSVGGYAFANCIGVTDISIQGNLKTLAEGVFSSCSALTTVTIPSSVTVVDKKAFANCAKLTSVTLPSGIKTIGDEAFTHCSALTGVVLPNTLTSIGKSAFSYCASLTGITVPTSVTALQEGVFSNCTKLTNVTLPSTLKSIGYKTFSYCSSLTGINIPASVTVIESSAFSYCSKLLEIELPSSVKTIGTWAFLACTGLTRVSIPSTVTSIGGGAFYSCSKLASISTQAVTPQLITSNVFFAVNKTTCSLTVPANTAELYRKAAVWSEFTAISEMEAPTLEKSLVVSLAAGWNVISGNVMPTNNNIATVFGGLVTSGSLRKVLDESGLSYERVSQQTGWVNSIGNFRQTEGYKVHMKVAGKLTLTGLAVGLPFDIPLKAGWNIVPCPYENEKDAMMIFQPLIQSGTLVKVMDESGNSIENFGAYGGWRNTIGNLKPGKGYLVNMARADTLSMGGNLPRAAAATADVDTTKTTHFIKSFTGNGLNHMNINLVDLGASDFKVGDEIGIFDGTVCVGSTILRADQIAANSVSVITSSNDGLTSVPNGFTPGNQLTIMAYSNQDTYELSIETLWGSNTFEENGSLFAKVVAKMPLPTGIHNEVKKSDVSCYPNPFTDQVSIDIRQEAGSKLTVDIYNLAGQRIVRLFQGISSGDNHLTWNGTDERGFPVAPGTYICRHNGYSQLILRSGK